MLLPAQVLQALFSIKGEMRKKEITPHQPESQEEKSPHMEIYHHLEA